MSATDELRELARDEPEAFRRVIGKTDPDGQLRPWLQRILEEANGGGGD